MAITQRQLKEEARRMDIAWRWHLVQVIILCIGVVVGFVLGMTYLITML